MSNVQLYGKNEYGVFEFIDTIDEDLIITERNKFAQILQTYFKGDPFDDTSESSLAMGAFDDFLQWRKERDEKLERLKLSKGYDDGNA